MTELRTVLTDTRTEFLGGWNLNDSQFNIKPNEFSQLINARVDAGRGRPSSGQIDQNAKFGAIVKRRGTRRIHDNVIGVVGDRTVRGIFQWDAPAGLQTVAVAGGRFYHKLGEIGEFTEVIPGTAITAGPISWQPFRANSSGAPLVLYFAASGQIWKWDGTTLTKIDGVSNVPAGSVLRSYGTRMFISGVANFKKHIFWSKIGDAEVFTTGGAADGGSAMVDVLTGDAITALEVFGASLFIFTSDSIIRLTGVSNEDIQIDQDVSGIASMLGVRKLSHVVLTDVGIAVLTKRGLYMVTESDIRLLSTKVSPNLAVLATDEILDNSFIFSNNTFTEIWIETPNSFGAAETFVYNYYIDAWRRVDFAGDSANASTGARWRGSTTFSGDRSVIGTEGGFVLLTEGDSFKDNSDGLSGGDEFTVTIIFAPYFVNPIHEDKIVTRIYVIAGTGGSTTLTFQVTDILTLTASTAQIIESGSPSAPRTHRLDFNQHCRWAVVSVTDTGGSQFVIYGLTVEAVHMERD